MIWAGGHPKRNPSDPAESKKVPPLEIFTDREGEIILKKYSPIGELSLFAKEYAESLSHSTGMLSCITDHDQVVAAGPGSKEFIGKLISSQLKLLSMTRSQNGLVPKTVGKVPWWMNSQFHPHPRLSSPS